MDFGLMQLVRESDKRIIRDRKANLPLAVRDYFEDLDDDEEAVCVFYEVPASVVRDRLELKGYTLDVAKTALTRGLRHDAEMFQKWADKNHVDLFAQTAEALKTANADSWIEGLQSIRQRGLERRPHGRVDLDPDLEGTLIGHILTHDWYGCQIRTAMWGYA